MSVLLTGHIGFIGSHLYRALNELGEQIVGSDPRVWGPENWDELLRIHGPDLKAVFHLGAISDTTCEDAAALFETNVKLTLRLAEFCAEKRIPFIYASSASVYGNGRGPLNAYAKSKLQADMATSRLIPSRQYGLRFTNVYGPGEAHKGKQASMVHQCIERQRDGEKPRLFYIDAKRDFVHVDDVVSVMIWCWKTRPASGVYDVGTGIARSFEELIDAAEKVQNISHGYDFIPFPASLEGKYQFHTQADLTKLRAAGYTKPFLTLEEGIARMRK